MSNPKFTGEPSLRARALQLLRQDNHHQILELEPADLRKALQELHIYQIELELQNEDLRRSQEDLERSRQEYSDLFESAPVGYAVLSAEGIIEQANQTLSRLLNQGKEKLYKRALNKFILPDDYPVFYQLLRQINKGKKNVMIDLTLVPDKGTQFIARLVGDRPAGHGKGANNHIRVSVMDITEQKRLEEALLHSRKLEAVGRLSGGIAHDFNNILHSVQGYSELIGLDLPPESHVREHLYQLQASLNRAINLVQQILAVGRQDFNQQKERVLPQQLIREVSERLRQLVPDNVQVHLALDDNCPPIEADPGQMFQVLLNLFNNAIAALEERGGTITISANPIRVPGNEYIDSGQQKPGKYVELKVEDTGIGMQQTVLDQVFDPYYTTKPSVTDGTGLGLAVVEGIVATHGGFIAVESKPGAGSTFRVCMPSPADDAY